MTCCWLAQKIILIWSENWANILLYIVHYCKQVKWDDLVQKHFLLCWLKITSHLIVITKLSGPNVFICIYIIFVIRRTITCSSNQIPRPESYDKLSYLPVNVCICIPPRTVTMWLYITLQLHIISQSWFGSTNCNTVCLYILQCDCFFLLFFTLKH